MKFDTTGLESYLSNPELEAEDGVWLVFPNDRKFHVLRAGGSNKKFLRAFQRAIKPYRRQLDRGALDTDVSDRIMRELYATYVVVDWSGIKDAEGHSVPYTPESAIAFFEAFPELFGEIVSMCTDVTTFSEQRVEEVKEVLGEA